MADGNPTEPDVNPQPHGQDAEDVAGGPFQAQTPRPGISLLKQARQARRRGEDERARALLRQHLADQPDDERAWLLLADLTRSAPERAAALEEVLRLNPGQQAAKAQLERLRKLLDEPLALAKLYDQQGELENAIAAYERAALLSPSASERLQAEKGAEMARLRQGPANARHPSSGMTLVRLSAGLPLFYLLLLMMHAGLNLLRIPALYYLGLLAVLAGSVLVTAAQLYPDQNHPRVVHWLKRLEKRLPLLRSFELQMVGMLLVAVPFMVLLVDSFARAAAP